MGKPKETIGSAWGRELAEAKKREKGENPRIVAQQIIEAAPKLITEARAKGAESAELFGWVSWHDVPGTGKDKMDALAARLRQEKRPLRADDLTGRARIVFDWCDRNGLEAFLVSVDAGMHETEYNFHVRPKRD